MSPLASNITLAVWGAGWPVAARVIYRTMDDGGDMGGEERFAASFLGLFWPFILMILAVIGVFFLPTIRYTTVAERHQRQQDAAEAERREKERLRSRIAELEREAGIRDDRSSERRHDA